MAVTITMTPIDGGSSLIKVGDTNKITFTGVPKGTYNVQVTESGYSSYNQQLVVDDDIEEFTVTLTKSAGSGSVVVFDSKVDGVSFTESASIGYLRVESIKLEPNTTYVVSTTNIQVGNSLNNTANLFANSIKAWTADNAVTPTKSQTVTTDSTGYVYIAGKPRTDPDGTSISYNVEQIKHGTYNFTIKTA